MAYSLEGLRRGIDNCLKNIQVFEDAIRKEQDTIREYKGYIKELLKREENNGD